MIDLGDKLETVVADRMLEYSWQHRQAVVHWCQANLAGNSWRLCQGQARTGWRSGSSQLVYTGIAFEHAEDAVAYRLLWPRARAHENL